MVRMTEAGGAAHGEASTEAWRVTDAEAEWYAMGPFDGGVPGLVRRIRRILDVSQRGLAAMLEVSQSVVARWETGRTSPRVSVVRRLLRMAGLDVRFHDEDGSLVEPMRDDGARDRGGRRYPAHVDLTVRGWWIPRGVECTPDFLLWQQLSRAGCDPAIRFHTSRFWRRIDRMIHGTPEDHPALSQLVAEAEHLDELREQRRREVVLPRAAVPQPRASRSAPIVVSGP